MARLVWLVFLLLVVVVPAASLTGSAVFDCVSNTAASLANRVSCGTTLLATGSARLHLDATFMSELQIRWNGATAAQVTAAKDTLFGLVDGSKGHPELAAVASNAVSIQNWMDVSLSGKSWAGVQIPKSYLPFADLSSSDLQGADLSGSFMYRVKLTNAKLQRAVMTGVEFGERVSCSYGDIIYDFAYSPDGQYVVAACGSTNPGSVNTVRQWEAQTGAPRGLPIALPTWSAMVLYSPDGASIVSGGSDHQLRRFVAASGAPIGNELSKHTMGVRTVVYSPDGQIIASSGLDGTIRQWNAQTGGDVSIPISASAQYIYNVKYSPDGKTIASTGDDGSIRRWVAATGQQIGIAMTGHSGRVRAVAYSPNGQFMASGGYDGTVRQWDASSGAPFGPVLTSHTDNVFKVMYSPDSKYIASASYDGTVRQWVAATGMPFGPTLSINRGPIHGLSYSPDGRYIASTSDDNKVHQWLATPGQPYDTPVWKAHDTAYMSIACSGSDLTNAGGLNVEQVALLQSAGCSTASASCAAGSYLNSDTSACDTCAAGQFSATVGASVSSACQPCASGTFSAAGASACVQCPTGRFSGTGASSCDCPAGYSGSGSSCTRCPPGSFKESIGSTCTPCSAGTFLGQSGASSAAACLRCGLGAFSGQASSACRTCPNGTTTLFSGQARCTKCPNPGNCIETRNGTICAAGSTGRLCSECLPGYFALLGACNTCPSGWWLTMLVGLMFFGGLAFLAWLGVWDEHTSNMLRSLSTYTQLVHVQFSFALKWPTWLAVAADMIQTTIGSFGVLYSPQCLQVRLSWYQQFWLVVGLSFAMLTVPHIIRLGLFQRARVLHSKRIQGETVANPHRLFELSVSALDVWGTVAMIVYMPLYRTFAQALDCIESPSGDLLRADPSLVCGTGSLVGLQVFAGIMLVLQGFALPIATAYVVRKLNQSHGLYQSVLGRSLQPFYAPYKDSFRYMEAIIMIRKSVAVLLEEFARDSPAAQPIVTLLFAGAMLVIIIREKPWIPVSLAIGPVSFTKDSMNALMLAAVSTEVVIAVCGLVTFGGSGAASAAGGIAAAVYGGVLALLAVLTAHGTWQRMQDKKHSSRSAMYSVELLRQWVAAGQEQRLIGAARHGRQVTHIELDATDRELKDLAASLTGGRIVDPVAVGLRRATLVQEFDRLNALLVDPNYGATAAAMEKQWASQVSATLDELWHALETARHKPNFTVDHAMSLLPPARQCVAQCQAAFAEVIDPALDSVCWVDQLIVVIHAEQRCLAQGAGLDGERIPVSPTWASDSQAYRQCESIRQNEHQAAAAGNLARASVLRDQAASIASLVVEQLERSLQQAQEARAFWLYLEALDKLAQVRVVFAKHRPQFQQFSLTLDAGAVGDELEQLLSQGQALQDACNRLRQDAEAWLKGMASSDRAVLAAAVKRSDIMVAQRDTLKAQCLQLVPKLRDAREYRLCALVEQLQQTIMQAVSEQAGRVTVSIA